MNPPQGRVRSSAHIAKRYLEVCNERSDRLGVEEPADRITKDNGRLIRSSSSTSVAVTTATRQKRHDEPNR
jgi:hypothetical protein